MKNNKGSHVQMEGFMSTSLSKLIAYNFAWTVPGYNTIIEIEVDTTTPAGQYDFGYAYQDAKGEEEILFNPINVFEVVEVSVKML